MPTLTEASQPQTIPTILGIDPGTQVTGWGIITATKRPQMIGCGAIRTKSGDPLELRLHHIFSEIDELLVRFAPITLAVEDPFVGKNPRSALVLGQARGVVLVAGVRRGVPVAHYPPRSVKSAIVGKGSASKEQVQFMVQKLLGLKEAPKPLDASDAVAVALCHLHRGRIARRF